MQYVRFSLCRIAKELKSKALKSGIERLQVFGAKNRKMNQERIQVVHVSALIKEFFFDWQYFAIRGKELPAYAIKERHVGEFHFIMSVIERRVDDARDTAVTHDDIRAPHVTMNKDRAMWFDHVLLNATGEIHQSGVQLRR